MLEIMVALKENNYPILANKVESIIQDYKNRILNLPHSSGLLDEWGAAVVPHILGIKDLKKKK
jgi:hypothetical protein